MRLRLCLAIVSLAAGCGPGAPPPPPRAAAFPQGPLLPALHGAEGAPASRCRDELQPLVEQTMADLGVPGAIVWVDVPGSCRWIATLGTREAGTNRPMSLEDHLRIGSITKTFTGTAVLQLVDEGWVELDEPVSTYLRGVPNGDAITVRQLLHMTSRLYNYSDDLAFNRSLDEDPGRVWQIPELLAIGLGGAPYPPGFHYSNTNSVLLGRIVETVTHRPLREELERRIFRPLRLRDTSLPALRDASIPEPHPRGYMFGTNVGTIPPACDADAVELHDVTDASPSWAWAAGGAISTVRDLVVWARALALGTLLTPETQAERLQWVPTRDPPSPGYGLHITNFFGVLGHDGALPGFQSFMGYRPDRGATVIVLTNVYPSSDCENSGAADAIARKLLARLGLLTP